MPRLPRKMGSLGRLRPWSYRAVVGGSGAGTVGPCSLRSPSCYGVHEALCHLWQFQGHSVNCCFLPVHLFSSIFSFYLPLLSFQYRSSSALWFVSFQAPGLLWLPISPEGNLYLGSRLGPSRQQIPSSTCFVLNFLLEHTLTYL